MSCRRGECSVGLLMACKTCCLSYWATHRALECYVTWFNSCISPMSALVEQQFPHEPCRFQFCLRRGRTLLRKEKEQWLHVRFLWEVTREGSIVLGLTHLNQQQPLKTRFLPALPSSYANPPVICSPYCIRRGRIPFSVKSKCLGQKFKMGSNLGTYFQPSSIPLADS